MADDWPFLHLNLPSSSLDQQLPHPNQQDLSLFPFDSRQLDAWTNINFSFDDPARYSASSPGLPPKSALPPAQDPFQLLRSSAPADAPHPFLDPAGLLFGQPDQFVDRPPHPDQNPSPKTDLFECPLVPLVASPVDRRSAGARPSRNTPASSSFVNAPQPAESTVDDHSSPVKHDNTTPNSHPDDDDANRVAVEEDKRRRNTLASAKFRMKKKMKEQETERTAREMKERVSELEKEVENLKQENKWLRGLIVDSTASKLVQARELEQTTSKSMIGTTVTKRRINGKQNDDELPHELSKRRVRKVVDESDVDDEEVEEGGRLEVVTKYLKKS